MDPLPLPPGRAFAAGLSQQQPVAVVSAGRIDGLTRHLREARHLVSTATVRRDLRAHAFDSSPTFAETGVQREEMRLPVCELSCETACDAACMCICVHSCSSDGVRERASVDA